jgi:hypothetical protein
MLLRRLWGKYSLSYLASFGMRFTSRLVTSRIRTLPDFLIIGAQRCGTTSLYNHLVTHPGVFPAFMKETHFFDFNYNKGLNWYKSYFPLAAQVKQYQKTHHQLPVTGEATPYYIFHPQVPERVFAAIPTAKLIVLLRNPVHRAFSHYHHEVKQGFEQRTFEEAVNHDLECMPLEHSKLEKEKNYHSFEHVHHSYVSRGIYIDQLCSWMKWFPREQVLVLKSETFYLEPAKTVAETFRFLDLPDWKPDSFPMYNVNRYTEMGATIQQTLTQFFEPHNQRLYQFLNSDFGW